MAYSDPERHRAYQQRYQAKQRADNPEKQKAIRNGWNQRNPERLAAMNRKVGLKRKFGLTVAEYDSILRQQGCRCKICKQLPFKRRLAVDHDHVTGKVRGLLCHECNLGLGKFRDDPLRLIEAAKYLQENQNVS